VSDAASDERIVTRRWNRPQSRFLKIRAVPNGPTQYLDFEGAVGSGKTTAPAWKMAWYATEYPGIHMCLAAWTDDMLGPPKAAFRDASHEQGLALEWHGGQGEDYYEVAGYGSRIYLRSLRASEDTMRTQKLAGLNLSVIWIDQPEPVEEDIYRAYVPARLRQPTFPHEVWLSPNPLSEAHWLSAEFPTDPAKALANHHYIHTSIRDNVAHVGEQFIADMEAAHPIGSPSRARLVDGTRAPIVRGKPIYSSQFRRAVHVREDVEALPDHPVYDSWDFGQQHPACVFTQLTWWGQLRILGAIEGSNIFLENFAPLVKEIRAQWFGEQATYETTCDPAGTTGNAHGTILNGIKILNAHEIYPVTSFNLNRVEGISYAIETIGGFMSRDVVQPRYDWCGCAYCERVHPSGREGMRLPFHLVVDGGRILHGLKVPAFVVHKSRHVRLSNTDSTPWPVLINGFEAGYVHDSRVAHGQSNLKRPLKDGEHDHTQRCVEYTVQQFWKPRPVGEQLERDIQQIAKQTAREQQRQLREVCKRDYDASDWHYGKNMHMHRDKVARMPDAAKWASGFARMYRGGW